MTEWPLIRHTSERGGEFDRSGWTGLGVTGTRHRGREGRHTAARTPYSAGWWWGNRQTLKDPRVRFAHWRGETYGFCQPFRTSPVGDGRNAARRGEAV